MGGKLASSLVTGTNFIEPEQSIPNVGFCCPEGRQRHLLNATRPPAA